MTSLVTMEGFLQLKLSKQCYFELEFVELVTLHPESHSSLGLGFSDCHLAESQINGK